LEERRRLDKKQENAKPSPEIEYEVQPAEWRSDTQVMDHVAQCQWVHCLASVSEST
jgi:hypothetical protein